VALGTKQRGLALVELGISIFVMISIAFGITEFGRAITSTTRRQSRSRRNAYVLSGRGRYRCEGRRQVLRRVR
jgi:hypothetical protein